MSLKDDKIGVRDPENMPPLLLRLSERPPKEVLQWLGVSYGITQQLHKFWKRSGYTPVYVRQTSNELTGEHTCIMLKEINKTLERKEWLDAFSWDFRKRFIELLAYQFREFSPSMVLGILESSKSQKSEHQLVDSLEISRFFTPFDMKRLESYSKNLLDYHVILDLVPAISRLYYLNMLQGVDLSAVQGAIFVGLGLQKKSVDDLEGDLKLAVSQLLALFAKGIRKVSNSLRSILEEDVKIEMEVLDNDQNEKVKDINDDKAWEGLDTMDEELEEKGNEAMQALREKQREMIDGLGLERYLLY
jgi:N-acetyltransferase 10